ncbi:MAG: S8 family serine peptidase [Candidatus Thorarchaeota archaeon]
MCKLNKLRLNGFFLLFILHFSLLSIISFNFGSAFTLQKPDLELSPSSINFPTIYQDSKKLNHLSAWEDKSISNIQRDLNENESFNKTYQLINPKQLSAEGYSGENITIAVLDSGINKVDWITNLVASYTTIPNSTKVTDDYGHGTFIGAIISKIAYNAKLISIKVSDSSGFISSKSVEEGLKLALASNASIIHASLGSINLDALNASLISQINYENITTVFSAGNSGPFASSLTSPAIFAEAIAVGMAYNQTHIYPNSSSGPRPSGIMGPDIVAPGVDVTSQNQTQGFENRTGTSYAAAFVTGALALLKEAFPEITPPTLKAALLETAHFMNNTSPIRQGNGFIDISKAYQLLKNINSTNPLLSFAPRELSSYFTYFGHAVNGENRTYRLTLYSTIKTTLTDINTTQSFPSHNVTKELPINITVGTLPKSINTGLNYLNLSLNIPKNLKMAKREGNITFHFSNGTYSSNLSITIENRYPGGNILFYQGYDNDTFIPDGPTGSFSMLQKVLESYYGMNSNGAIRHNNLIEAYGPLIPTKEQHGRITLDDLQGYHILVLADIEYGISPQEISLIQEWVANGHSLLVLSYPSQIIDGSETLSNQTAINELLKPYGLSIEDDLTNLSRFHNATTSISDPIFDEKGWNFKYSGTSVKILAKNGGKVLATAYDSINDEQSPIAGYWEEPESKAKVVVFGGMLPFKDHGLNASLNDLEVITRIFRWMVKDQQVPLDILLTSSPTVDGSTQIQITMDKNDSKPFYGTIKEANGSFSQIIFERRINMYIASWSPLAAGHATLWLNLGTPTGVFVFDVINPGSQDIFFLAIIGGFILLGIVYYLLASRRPQKRSPIEQRVAIELQKRKSGPPHGGLETSEICSQCHTPRYTNESKYCFKCGKEL